MTVTGTHQRKFRTAWDDEEVVFLFTLIKLFKKEGASMSRITQVLASEKYFNTTEASISNTYYRNRDDERFKSILEGTYGMEDEDNRIEQRFTVETITLPSVAPVLVGDIRVDSILSNLQEIYSENVSLRNESAAHVAELAEKDAEISKRDQEIESLKLQLQQMNAHKDEYLEVVQLFKSLQSRLDIAAFPDFTRGRIHNSFGMEVNGNLVRI